MSSLGLAGARRCAAAAAAVGSLLGKHLPPDDQLTHPLLGRQRQQAVVLTVQAHVQQVLFRKMVGDQVGLRGERGLFKGIFCKLVLKDWSQQEEMNVLELNAFGTRSLFKSFG